jgi:gas vesicle protein
MSHYEDNPYIVIERRSGGIGAFLLGAIVGAGVALLFAPRSGEETRAEIRTGVRRLRERAEDTVRGVQDAVSQTLDNVRSGVNDKLDTARDAFEQGRQAARDTRDDMERRVRETRERVRAGIEAARRPPATASSAGTGDATTDLDG